MDLKEIGIIHSPYDRKGLNKPPSQGASVVLSQLEVYKKYQEGLLGLHPSDKIMVIYWADEAKRDQLLARRKGHGPKLGVFALRSPHRPNPLLVTEARIEKIEGNILSVRGLEALDGSSLIDIKISIDKD